MAKKTSNNQSCPIVHPGAVFNKIELSKNQCEKIGIAPGTRPLGCGVFGCAFISAKNEDRVIKVTRDREDVAALLKLRKSGLTPKLYSAKELKLKKPLEPSVELIKKYYDDMQKYDEVKQDPPGLDWWVLHRGGKQRAFVLEMERVFPLSDEQRQFLYDLYSAPHAVPLEECPPHSKCKNLIKMPGALNNAKAFCTARYEGSKRSRCKKFMQVGLKVKNGLLKNGIYWIDSHAGNWGMTRRGKLVALDIGLTNMPLKRKLKMLSGMGKLKMF
jgi:hypothetical protein